MRGELCHGCGDDPQDPPSRPLRRCSVAPRRAPTTTRGRRIEQQLAEATKSAKVTVVHFWAPWCPNCKAELANGGWSGFIAANPDVNFVFVTIWNKADGHEVLEKNGVGGREELPAPPPPQRLAQAGARWCPQLLGPARSHGSRRPGSSRTAKLRYAMNYGELHFPVLQQLIKDSSDPWDHPSGAMPGKPSIAFVGTGVMGRSMAGHLMAAGPRASRLQPDAGKRRSRSWTRAPAGTTPPATRPPHADVVITMLGFPQDVEETYLGKGGIVERARHGRAPDRHDDIEPAPCAEDCGGRGRAGPRGPRRPRLGRRHRRQGGAARHHGRRATLPRSSGRSRSSPSSERTSRCRARRAPASTARWRTRSRAPSAWWRGSRRSPTPSRRASTPRASTAASAAARPAAGRSRTSGRAPSAATSPRDST